MTLLGGSNKCGVNNFFTAVTIVVLSARRTICPGAAVRIKSNFAFSIFNVCVGNSCCCKVKNGSYTVVVTVPDIGISILAPAVEHCAVVISFSSGPCIVHENIACGAGSVGVNLEFELNNPSAVVHSAGSKIAACDIRVNCNLDPVVIRGIRADVCRPLSSSACGVTCNVNIFAADCGNVAVFSVYCECIGAFANEGEEVLIIHINKE